MFSAQVSQWNDTRDTLGATLGALAQALTFATEFRDSQGKRLDEVGTVEGQQYTVKEAILHGQQALRSFQALKLDKNKPVAAAPWQAALSAVSNLRDASNALLGLVSTVTSEGRPLAAVTGSSITARETGDQVASFTAPASRIVAEADTLILNTATLLNSVRASDLARNNQEAGVVADDAKASASAAVEAEEASRLAIEAAAKVSDLLSEIAATKAATEASVTTSSAALSEQTTESTRLLDQVKATAATVEQNAAVVNARLSDVNALKSQMDASSQAVTAYNSTLETTQARVQHVEKAASDVVADFQAKRDEIAQMLADAEHMLSASTVAGLATAFDAERKSLDRGMLWAQSWFVAGIILLILATLPLLSYVSNVPLDLKSLSLNGLLTNKPNYDLTLAGVLSRSIVILGPFWLTLFNARRYRSLFELRQQYSHKYNMAFSMEGFKKQAPGFSEGIAAWVFSIVAASPVQQKPGGPMDEAPSTSFKDFVDLAVKRLQTAFGIKNEPAP